MDTKADLGSLGILEALLFVSEEPLSLERIEELLDGCSRAEANRLLADLQERYRDRDRGVVVTEVAGGYRLTTKPEVEVIRGVMVDGVLKTLVERDLVRILGRKAEVGRPILYGTSRSFLEYFGFKDLSELPTLKEIETLTPNVIEQEASHETVDQTEKTE